MCGFRTGLKSRELNRIPRIIGLGKLKTKSIKQYVYKTPNGNNHSQTDDAVNHPVSSFLLGFLVVADYIRDNSPDKVDQAQSDNHRNNDIQYISDSADYILNRSYCGLKSTVAGGKSQRRRHAQSENRQHH